MTVLAPPAAAVLARIPQWLMHSHGLDSRELIGVVRRTTAKAVLLRGTANVRGSLHCLRCSRPLERQVSRDIGYGPDCCEKLGIPWDADTATARRLVQAREVELWLPLSKVTLHALDGGEPPPLEPEQQPDPAATLATVTEDGLHIRVRTSFELRDRCRRVTGWDWKPRWKVWQYPASPSIAAALVSAFQGVPFDVDPAFRALLDQAEKAAGSASRRHATDLPDVPGLKTSAWGHQRQAFWFAEHLRAAMFAMGMGTGKSLVQVGLTYQRVPPGGMALVVCPLKVTDVWPREYRRHAGYDVAVLQMASNSGQVKGTIASRLARLEKQIVIAKARGQRIVVVINYDAVWRDVFARWAMTQTWDLITLDESQKAKAPNGKASTFLSRLGQKAKNRACLTGTPLANSPLDAYAQYRFLDPGIFGTSFARFRQRYAVMGGYGGYQVMGYQRQDELSEKIYSIGFKVGDEVLDLPEAVDAAPLEGPIGAEALRLYRKISDDLYAIREGGAEFTATNVLTRLLRQQQLTGGAITDDDGMTHEVDTMKEGLLRDLLDDTDPLEPIVVFTRFVHDLDVVARCAEASGRRYGELSGRRKDALNDQGEMNEDCDIVAVQIQSGGLGVDLTRARYCVFFSLGFSLTDYLQARKRVHRPGQERPVTYYHLIASNVDVDRKVYAALEAKEDVVRFIMDEMGGADR